MKVIDLLIKIHNGEELPKIIKYKDYILYYEKDMKDYYDKEGNHPLLDTQCQFILNDEITIIEDTLKELQFCSKCEQYEYTDNFGNRIGVKLQDILKEDKKIEKLDLQYKDITKGIKFEEQILMYCDNLQFKINEIIDKVNGE